MKELDNVLQHWGVKGMKWGVRKDKLSSSKSGKGEEPKRSKFGKRLDSWKREREWNAVLKKMHSMNTKDIRLVTSRIKLENSLKKLAKSNVATTSDKEDYLRRGKMSNQELSRKVSRLQAKEELHKAVKSASKEQREFGEKVVQIGSSIGVKYAINRKIQPSDIFEAVTQPKKAAGDAKRDATKTILDKTNLSADAKKMLSETINKSDKKDKKS